jgi:hypothetical protein
MGSPESPQRRPLFFADCALPVQARVRLRVVGDDPELLDVVPWSHGYAHSWVLRWLIGHEPSRTPILNLLAGFDGGPWALTRPVAREFSVRRARADLAAWATGRDGEPVAIAVEVKVNDPISEMQLAAYVAADLSPVLYVPGLTGLMFAPNGPLIGERWVTGLDVAGAVDGIELPPMIGSYVDAVRSEGCRMELAKAFSRNEVDNFPEDGQAGYDDVMDCGWVAEVALALRRLGASDVIIRPERNDRGVFWKGCQRVLPGGAEVYIDVVADRRSHHCSIAIKVKGGDHDARVAAWERVLDAGPPPPPESSADEWVRGRRPSANSGRIWSLNASESDAATAAADTLSAGAFIARAAAA